MVHFGLQSFSQHSSNEVSLLSCLVCLLEKNRRLGMIGKIACQPNSLWRINWKEQHKTLLELSNCLFNWCYLTLDILTTKPQHLEFLTTLDRSSDVGRWGRFSEASCVTYLQLPTGPCLRPEQSKAISQITQLMWTVLWTRSYVSVKFTRCWVHGQPK